MKQVADITPGALARRALVGLLITSLAACDSGSSSSSSGSGPAPGLTPVDVDFALRRDLHLGMVQSQVADMHGKFKFDGAPWPAQVRPAAGEIDDGGQGRDMEGKTCKLTLDTSCAPI